MYFCRQGQSIAAACTAVTWLGIVKRTDHAAASLSLASVRACSMDLYHLDGTVSSCSTSSAP